MPRAPKIPPAMFSDSPEPSMGGKGTGARTTGPRKTAKRPAAKKTAKKATKRTTKKATAANTTIVDEPIESTVTIISEQLLLPPSDVDVNGPVNRLAHLMRAWVPADATTLTPAIAAYLGQRARLSGYAWEVIAKVLGYTNAAAAESAVRRQLESAAISLDDSTRGMALTLATERFDHLISLAMPLAENVTEDPTTALRAMREIARLEMQRAKLLRLDQATDTHIEQRNVIIHLDGENGLAQLEAIANGADPYEIADAL